MTILRVSLAFTLLVAANLVGLMAYHHVRFVQQRNEARQILQRPPTLPVVPRDYVVPPPLRTIPASAPPVWQGPRFIDTHPIRGLDLEAYPDPDAELYFTPIESTRKR